jgi:hypothetical protein
MLRDDKKRDMIFTGKKFSALLVFLMLPWYHCSSGESTPEKTLSAVQEKAQSGKLAGIGEHLTGDTVAAINRLKDYPAVNWQNDFASRFPEGSEWEVVHREVKGDDALITIKCVDHPVENVVGFQTDYRMRREGGVWKIDMHEQLERAADRLKEFRDFGTKR